MTHWGMVVDLARCVGCQTCTIACKMENGLPPDTLWRTVLDLESGIFPDVNRTFFPLTCMQCAEPPCHDACPTTATKVRADGIVWIDNDICIGCGSCVVACPYQARHLVPKEKYYFGEATAPELATYERERVGICTKCNFCFHKYDNAPEGVVPGVDPEYTPSCSSSCIADAIVFGDLADPDSRVSQMVAHSNHSVRLLEHLGTQPSVHYLNPPRIEAQPPRLQRTWHGLAVTNFFCGTTGPGLYALGILCAWVEGHTLRPLLNPGDIPGSLQAVLGGAFDTGHLSGLLGPLLVSIGLLAVAAEAGRPFRGFNVFRNLHHSWMSRESGFAMVFMVLAVLDTLFVAHPALQIAAVISGLGMTLSQGLILANAKGVPAWNVPRMPRVFITSALASGFGAFMVLEGTFGEIRGFGPIVVGLGLTLASGWNWLHYLRTPPQTATFKRSMAVLRQPLWQAGILGLGHGIPIVLLIAAWLLPALFTPLLMTAGVALVTGSLIAKYALIMRAAFWVDLFDNFPTPQTAPQPVPALATESAAA